MPPMVTAPDDHAHLQLTDEEARIGEIPYATAWSTNGCG